MRQRLAVLGSTGSIGEQTLDIIRNYPDHFEATTLTSNRNWEKLAHQAIEFMPDSVVIADKDFYKPLQEALLSYPIKVYAGHDAISQIVSNSEVDTVVNALVGYAGLAPTIAALEAGKKLALANKESLVVAGKIVMEKSLTNRAPIIPVDSEHSAIFQCLTGERNAVSKLILTASGGPFLDTPAEEFVSIDVDTALKHPNWEMGPKITIDSATMMNKGLEVIEAHWLFGIDADKIEVIVHPQSIVHSLVEFADGALKAQLGSPDMHLPIQYALTFPERWPIADAPAFRFSDCGSLDFRTPDYDKFPALSLAYQALRTGGNSCCILNAANEVAVNAFLEGRIGFTDIHRIIESSLTAIPHIANPSLEDHQQSDYETRTFAKTRIKK